MNRRTKRDITKLIIEVEKDLKAAQFDPNGSYTGLDCDGESPVQDQDDL